MVERTLIERLNIPWPEHETEEVTLPAWVLELCAEGAARIAALEAQLAERVRVKPLVWRTSADGKMFAITPVGLGYSVFGSPLGDAWLLELQCGSVVTAEAHSSEEEAIGYAQADYERRIRSALEATPAPMVTFPGCVVSLNGTKISMAFETDEDAQTVFRLIEHIIDSTASEAK